MTALNLLLHLLNAFSAPVAVAVLTVGLAKGLVWRRALAGAAWRPLLLGSVVCACAGQVLVLAVLGADGRLLGYALWMALMALPLGRALLRSV